MWLLGELRLISHYLVVFPNNEHGCGEWRLGELGLISHYLVEFPKNEHGCSECGILVRYASYHIMSLCFQMMSMVVVSAASW